MYSYMYFDVLFEVSEKRNSVPWVVVDTGVVVDTMCMSAMQSARMLGESFLSRQNE